MKTPFYKKCEIVTALMLICVILFFCVTTVVKEGRYIAVSAKKNSIDTASEEDSIFDTARSLFKATENAFADSIYKREKFTPLASKLNSILMRERTIESSQVLLGKEDWLFYKTETDGQPLKDYAGSDYYDTAKMDEITGSLKANKDYLESRGIEFALMIVPNKEQIYPEYMPDTTIRYSEVSRTDVLVDHIKNNSDVNVIYPKKELSELSKDYALYYKYDSHWTQLGSFIAYQQMTDALFGQREYLSDKSISVASDTNRNFCDLLDMTGLHSWFGYDNYYSISDISDKKYEKTILFVGDSCREALVEYLNKGFTKAVIIHRDNYSAQLLDEYDPDIVVLEYVERYSGRMDDFSFSHTP